MAKIVRYEMRIVKVGSVREDVGNPAQIVTAPEHMIPIVHSFCNQEQECFVTVTLNCAGEVISARVNTVGLVNRALIDPREVFRGAIVDNAKSIIIAHNHPSGSLDPSPQDIAITTQIKQAGDVVGIQLLDHVIVTPSGAITSFRERGLI